MDPDYIRYPLVLGHEWSGTVAAVGDQVTKVVPGDAVVVEGIIPCSVCEACRRGQTNLCAIYDELGFMRDGAAGPSVTTREHLVHRLDAGVPLVSGALVEPASVVLRGLSLHGSPARSPRRRHRCRHPRVARGAPRPAVVARAGHRHGPPPRPGRAGLRDGGGRVRDRASRAPVLRRGDRGGRDAHGRRQRARGGPAWGPGPPARDLRARQDDPAEPGRHRQQRPPGPRQLRLHGRRLGTGRGAPQRRPARPAALVTHRFSLDQYEAALHTLATPTQAARGKVLLDL